MVTDASLPSAPIDRGEFRSALGHFPTGVTIVTTMGEDGAPVGVTASSFNSVSLDPPLVLWSLSRSSKASAAFCNSGHFAIHILSAAQEDLSNRFARSGEDKFSGVQYEGGVLGSPVLDQFAALFQCRTMHQYEGGDHVILVGEVVGFERRDEAPLLFHRGRYAETLARAAGGSIDAVDVENGAFTDEFLFYLLSRAHFQTSRPARIEQEKLGLSQADHLTLALLSMQGSTDAQRISELLDHTGSAPTVAELEHMVATGLLDHDERGYRLAHHGRNKLVQILSVSKAHEDSLLALLTPGEAGEIKRLLRKIIDLTRGEISLDWRAQT